MESPETTTRQHRPASSRRAAAVFAALAILSLALYWPSFDNGFRDDDFAFLAMARSENGAGDLVAPHSGIAFYRPGAWILFAAEYRLFAMHPGRYLAFNWVLHLVNALLLFAVLRRAGYRRDIAAWSAGLFVVGYGHFGKEVMWASTSGGLAAVALSLVIVRLSLALSDPARKDRRQWPGPVVALLAFVAPAFHESALMAPFIALALCWGAYGRGAVVVKRSRLWWTASAALWLVVIAAMASTHGSITHAGHALAAAPVRIVRYTGLMALPIQNSDLLARFSPLLSTAAPVIQFLLGAAVIFAAWTAARRRRGAGALLAWILLALAPFSLIGVASHWLELRYVYLASMGFAALVARFLDARRTAVRYPLIAVVLLMTLSVTALLERKYAAAANSDANRARLEQLDAPQ